MEFAVSVLRIVDEDPEPLVQAELDVNAKHCKALDVYLFEGDWEMYFNADSHDVDCLGEIIVPSLGNLSDEEIAELVRDQIPADKLKLD